MCRNIKWLAACCLFFTVTASSQSYSVRFFPADSSLLVHQSFIANVGGHFFMLNRSNRNAFELNVYDTVTKTNTAVVIPIRMDIISIITNQHSVSFIGARQQFADSISYHFFEIDETGKVIRKKEGIFSIIATQLRGVTSPDNKHVLFYQYTRFPFSNDTIRIHGTMIGSDGQIEKTISLDLKGDKERIDIPETFVDNNGNTHVFVFDKYNNYRLSTDLYVNTLYFPSDQWTSEIFTLDKVKLRTMQIFWNKTRNCMQLEGLFADGNDKNTSGIYSISLPYERKNRIVSKFVPFETEMLKAFRRGFTATLSAIRNSLHIKEWRYSDSGSLVVLTLNSFSLAAPGEAPGRYIVPRVFPGGRNFSINMEDPLLLSTSKSSDAPKQIFLKMGGKDELDWYYIQKLDFFLANRSNYNSVQLFSDSPDIAMLLYLPDRERLPHPTIVSIRDDAPVMAPLALRQLVFSTVRYLKNNQYGAIYLNRENGEMGFMVIHSAP